ncbi:MAG TPA: alpha-D-ribose 1-methylphosphonate 5-phosphate C-P-lyase PhnJ [bacterium]|nr:alpha-D-ribose 1-methylphosphonate 5-phosphate C-P-lyase PhnJ [bacterium]
MASIREFLTLPRDRQRRYNFAYLDEHSKREVRRRLLKAVAIPGHQVPFASRELPIARGWGTGGLQITLALIGPHDVLKVIDQGADDSVNAVNLRQLIVRTTGVRTTTDTRHATVVQTRHRIPEEPMTADQVLVLQVPEPEPLRHVEPSTVRARRMHAEGDYSAMWVRLYEDVVRWGEVTISSQYPVRVHRRYVMDPTPIPRWDVPRLHRAEVLYLFGAGREKRLYAVPPFTEVEPLAFDDVPFRVEEFGGARCRRCGSEASFLNASFDPVTGARTFVCSDTDYCTRRMAALRFEETAR